MMSDQYVPQEFAVTVKGTAKDALRSAHEFAHAEHLIGPVNVDRENGTIHARILARWVDICLWFDHSLMYESEGMEFPAGTLLFAGAPSVADRRGEWEAMDRG